MLYSAHDRLSDAELLLKTIATFKTPGLRDLAQSAPYLHTGGKDTFKDVIEFYRGMSNLARAGKLRNGDPEIARINLTPKDVPPLQAFLRALTEDYD